MMMLMMMMIENIFWKYHRGIPSWLRQGQINYLPIT